MNKYITKISLREPAQVDPKTGTPIRGKRASAHIYDDMMSAYQYVEQGVGLYTNFNMPHPDITIAVDTNDAARDLSMTVQEATRAVQGLANMGQAAAQGMRSINEALNAIRAQVNAMPDPLGEIQDRVFAEASHSQMSVQETIEQLISEYERRGE